MQQGTSQSTFPYHFVMRVYQNCDALLLQQRNFSTPFFLCAWNNYFCHVYSLLTSLHECLLENMKALPL
jgi:hypothetical protein